MEVSNRTKVSQCPHLEQVIRDTLTAGNTNKDMDLLTGRRVYHHRYFFYQNLSAQNQNSYGEEILFYYHRDIPQPHLNMSRQFLAKQKIIFKLYQFKDKSNHLAPSDEIIMIKSTIFVCIKFLLSNWNYIV